MNESIFKKDIQFLLGATNSNCIKKIQDSLPQFAFIGRSNVGKSSLINALTSRKKLARTSSTPGRTKQVNFFLLDNKLWLVDLPGYGYAKASKQERKSWDSLIESYFLHHKYSLYTVFVLIDSRRGILEIDRRLLEFLKQKEIKYCIVFTKIDKIKKSDLAEYQKSEGAIFTSVSAKLGIKDLACYVVNQM